jgi:hypothetical protein
VPSGRNNDPQRERRRPQRTAAPSLGGAGEAAASGAAHGLSRLVVSWRALSGEYRLAALASVGLFLSMFLPWYEQTATGVAQGKPVTASETLSAFQAFSWVEAAVLVVAFAILVLCFTRGERRSYHLPGGDGAVVMAGGIWVCLLVFLRQLDKPEPDAVAGLSTTMGVQWGIFVTFLFALLLVYAGLRLRVAHRPEPGPLDEAIATGHAPPVATHPDGRPRAAPPAMPERSAAAAAPAPADAPRPATPAARRHAAETAPVPEFEYDRHERRTEIAPEAEPEPDPEPPTAPTQAVPPKPARTPARDEDEHGEQLRFDA